MTGRLVDYIGSGLAAGLPAAGTVDAALTPGAAGFYYATDTQVLYCLDRSGTPAWDSLSNATGFATTTQTEEMIAGFISSPSDKSYTIALKMAHGGTITETTTKSVSGTCTATFKVNSTALGGTANSVSSTEQSQVHSSSNTFVTGDDIVLTVSANASCVDMSFSIKYTRVLA